MSDSKPAIDPARELDRILATDPAREVAKGIAARLVDLDQSQAAYLSYGQLAAFADVDAKDARLAQSVAVLASDKIGLLSLFYVYEDSEGSEHRLDAKAFEEALQLGFVVDPSSGKKDENFRRHLFPYFERRSS